MESSIKDNQAFIRFIDNMKLYIKDGDREIPVTKKIY